MNVASRSGLIPTPKKNFRKVQNRHENYKGIKCLVKPMPLVLKPFGGLHNPYAKGCSVLCNHPAPTAVRNFINQLKSSLGAESKSFYPRDNFEEEHLGESDNIPEDLFRRYTDTDSRPLTPSPTVTSVRTRNSAGSFLNNRRCITPELRKNDLSSRKKIILDLRRSHSQETLYWKPSSEISQCVLHDPEQRKRVTIEKKGKKQKPEDQHQKTPAHSPEEDQEEPKKPTITCINDSDLNDDEYRRGKKRKKSKTQPVTTTFHLSQDPETQVATLGPDSLNPSTRPSLIPNSTNLLPVKEKQEREPIFLKGSFLTDEALAVLKTELDVDAIENTFDRYLNRAMREAYKYIAPKAKEKKFNKSRETETLYYESHPKMPRKLSKAATRFDVPLDMSELEKMSAFDYLSKYVWISEQRKLLYKKVFLKNLIESEETDEVDDQHLENNLNEEYTERKMAAKSLPAALEEVLEFYGTEENIKEILRIIQVDESTEINFRTWCGIVAFGERLALRDIPPTDSSDELEKADFSSMELRQRSFKVVENLSEVLRIIRKGHIVEGGFI